jgi:Uma2 family endonuclease
MTAATKQTLTADEFMAWRETQEPGQRYELVGGGVVAMAPERAAHALVKHAAARALEDAIDAAGARCEVFPDGMSVVIGQDTVYEPDATVRCGDPVDRESVAIRDPVIVAEVISPSSRARDTGAKLEDYFRLPTLRHYLIIKTDTRSVIHHARGDDDKIRTAIVSAGSITLDPPGLVVALSSLFARL